MNNMKDEGHKLEDNKLNSNDDNIDKVVDTKLSLNPEADATASNIQKQILEDEIKELSPIKESEVDIEGVYAFKNKDKLEVKVFIRNGFSQAINFDVVEIALLDSKDTVLAKQLFNLKKLGDIPTSSARPWKLYFDNENVFSDKIPLKGWKVAFSNIEAGVYADVDFEGLPENISDESKFVLYKFLNELPKLKESTVGFSKFSMGIEESGNFLITLLIRNGCNKGVNIDKFPVTVRDDNKKVVFSAMFDFNIRINPYKARLVNLIYKTNLRPEKSVDLTDWNLTIEQVK